MPVSAPSDRRFKRSRVTPGRRRRWRRPSWKTHLSAAAGVIVLFGMTFWVASLVLSADRLSVRRVVIEGNQRLSDADVQRVLVNMEGLSIISLDLEYWQSQVQALRWVERAAVRRILPRTVEILVVERQPMAIGRLADRAVCH